MQTIQPHQISTEILNVIHDAQEYLVLVSPYVNLKNWERIQTELKSALKRNVKINCYVREEVNNFQSWEQLIQIGIKPKFVRNLHAKMYFNEKYGLLTSMNLLTSSNLSSIEAGVKYESELELNDLKNFVKNHLEPSAVTTQPNDEDLYLAKEKFQYVLKDYLSENLRQHVNCWWQDGGFQIQANNVYGLYFEKVRNSVEIYGIISTRERDQFNNFLENSGIANECVELRENSIKAKMNQSFSSTHFDHIQVSEKSMILDFALTFISELRAFKIDVYESQKIIKS